MAHYDPQEAFEVLKSRVSSTIKGQFPLEGRKNLLVATKVWVDDNRDIDDLRGQKEARLNDRTWAVPVRAEFELRDKETGKVKDRQVATVAQLPKITNRYTYIVGGTEYQVNNLFRLKSGVYTHVKENGELASQWNLAKGLNFNMDFDPKSKSMTINFSGTGSHIPLYPILKAMGVDDDTIERKWGKEILSANKKEKSDIALRKFYKAFKDEPPTSNDQAEKLVIEEFGRTQMRPEATKLTLGKPFDKVDGAALLAGSERILQVSRGEEQPDDRDSLEFKDLYSAEDLLSDRLVRKHKWDIKRKLLNGIDKHTEVKQIMGPDIFGKPIKAFFTQGTSTERPDQMNPMSYIGGNRRTTIRGEGGIQKEHQVVLSAKIINPSHTGFLDPIQSPECFDAETEVFTFKGWKYWKDVTDQDLLACRIDGALEFHKPEKLIRLPYKGPMYGLLASKIDYLVTPNHRVYHSTPWQPDVWKTDTADRIHGKERRFITSHAPFVLEDPIPVEEMFSLPEVEGGNALKLHSLIPMRDWAEFMGWYLSEGCVTYKEETSAYLVRISQSFKVNQENWGRLRSLFSRLPWTWSHDGERTSWATGSKQLAHYLKEFGFCNDKYIPEVFFRATTSIEARTALLESLLLGDGCLSGNRKDGRSYHQRVLTTTSQRLADDFERLAIGLGLPVSRKVYEDKREDRYLDVHEVRLLEHPVRTARPAHPYYPANYYTVDYDGIVYCATVPGSLLYVRRHGSVGFWSGNSEKIGTTLQLALGVRKRGTDIEIPVIKAKTGERVWISPTTALRSNLAFPDQYKKGDGQLTPVGTMVKATDSKGQISMMRPNQVDYVLNSTKAMFDLSANLIPYLQSNQGNRAMMASKQLEQAVSLKYREKPMVQVKSEGNQTFEEIVGGFTSHQSPEAGKVMKVKDDAILIRGKDGVRHEVQIYHHFPMNDDTSELHSHSLVQEGDDVKKGQVVADTNFTKDGTLALGTNLRVAYMPFKGYNYDDGIVISRSAANKLTSEHLFRNSVYAERNIILDKKKFRAQVGAVTSKAVMDKLDDDAVIKPGERVETGDVLIGSMRLEEITPDEQKVALISKKLVKPIKPRPLIWEKDVPGVVTQVVKHGKSITVYVSAETPADVGDKIVGRHGNKGIITGVFPDHEMPKSKDGVHAEVLLNPTGVPSRINVGQILETAASKIADKTGKTLIINNFDSSIPDYTRHLKKELDKLGLSDTEEMVDPVTGRSYGQVLTGKQYILKLHHTATKGLKARFRDAYDSNMTPRKGGPHGGQTMDAMGLYAMLAHNARENIREMQTFKSDKNDDFWTLLQAGESVPTPKIPFVFKKFEGYLRGMGLDIDKQGNDLILQPLTDKKTLEMSNGELKDAGATLVGRNLKPEPGGIFDSAITGTKGLGFLGDKWSHITLAERMPNPVFESSIISLLGLTSPQYKDIIESKKDLDGKTGPAAIVDALKKIDVSKEKKDLETAIPTSREGNLNKATRKLKYLRTLERLSMSPKEAYTIKHIPVLPPIMRPVTVLDSGKMNFDGLNKLYTMLANSNDKLKEFDPKVMPESEAHPLRSELYDGVKSLTLTGAVNKGRHLNSIATVISGEGQPKEGFFQDKVIGKRQDLSMRGTIVPEPSLSLDEVGIPRKAAQEIYKPFIVQRLVQQGRTPLQAQKLIKENTEEVSRALETVMSERPLLLKRDPVLHKFGVQAFIPRIVEGKAVKIHPLATSGYNADFDGDKMSAFVPVSSKAVKEAFKMVPSNNLFSPSNGYLMFKPTQESMMGLFKLTQFKPGIGVRHFNDVADAARAVKDGRLGMNDPVIIRDLKEIKAGLDKLSASKVTSVGRLMVYNALPPSDRHEKVLHDPKFTLGKDNLTDLLTEVAQKERGSFARVADKLKDLGNEASTGLSVSLKDFMSYANERDSVLDHAKKEESHVRTNSKFSQKKKDEEVVRIYSDAGKKIDSAVKKKLEGSQNRMYDWVKSGAKGNWDQFKQMTVAPMLVSDAKGVIVPVPITKSYSEGLDIGSYWTAMHGARMGTINRVEGTWQPGLASKQIMQTTMDQMIVSEDCGTGTGIRMGIDDRGIIGRYTVGDIDLGSRIGKDKGVIPNGTLVTPDLLNRFKNNKIADIRIRTPLKCAHGKGLCAKCYGINEEGKLHEVGTNVGVIAAQALGEPATQLSMNCVASGTLVSVLNPKDLMEILTLDQLWNKIDSTVDNDNGLETKISSGWKVWDYDRFTRVYTIQRHLPDDVMNLVRLEDGHAVVVQGNHPNWARRCIVICPHCGGDDPVKFVGHWKLSSRTNPKTSVRCPSCKGTFSIFRSLYEDQQEIVVDAKNLENMEMGTSSVWVPGKDSQKTRLPLPPYLLGIFVTEGNVRRLKTMPRMKEGRKHRNTASYGLHWKILSADISQKFGAVRTRIKAELKKAKLIFTEPSPKILQLNDTELSRNLWQQCGIHSYRKTLPPGWAVLSSIGRLDLLSGLIDGDGTITKNKICFDTTSVALVSQVTALVLSLGGIPAVYSTPWRRYSKHQGYRVSFTLPVRLTGVKRNKPVDGPAYKGSYRKVVSVKPVSYEGWTYDLATESKAFTANGIRTHNSFHTGGIVGARGTQAASTFTRLNQLLGLPERLPGSAVLSQADGHIEKIDKDPAGGWDVFIKGQRHYVPGSRELVVKRGDAVKKGDAITLGPKNPREMLKLTGLNSVQSYLVNEIQGVYKNTSPLSRRNTETFVRALTNLSEVKDPGSHPELLRGDMSPTSEIEDFNRKLPKDKKAIIHSPVLKGAAMLPLDLQEDWIALLQSRGLKQTIINAASEGWRSLVHSTHPIPGMARGSEFGKGTEKEPWLY